MKFSDSPDWMTITSRDYAETCYRVGRPGGSQKLAKSLVVEAQGQRYPFPSIREAAEFLGLTSDKLGANLGKHGGEYRTPGGAVVRYAA